MNKTSISGILLTVITTLLAACTGREQEEPTVAPESDANSISVFLSSRRAAATADNNDTVPIIYDEFAAGSLLYFSQKGTGNLLPNFEDESESANPYLYIYRYKGDPDAKWEEGVNFVNSNTSRRGFEWEDVLNVGVDGNTFKFFAFHFPVKNQVVWHVQEDQTGGPVDPFDKSNFLSSDILGAYHASSALFTRMRFRMFHLMTYLKITLYVPVYNGSADDYQNQNYSGYLENAVKGAYVMNAITEFGIDWAAAKSSDSEAPLVQTSASSPRKNVKMYRHDSDESEITELNVKDFYPYAISELPDGTDQVRAYHFSVLVPFQSFGDNFLCFALTTPGNDTKYYYFSGGQIIGDSGFYSPTQGSIQKLYLYLPRKTNETILVGANILPWQDAVTDMTVTQQ